MKILKSLKVINWHYISDETIEFEMINFLTGKTGVGKSTLVDCIQLVLQGDTYGNFFNNAAGNTGKMSGSSSIGSTGRNEKRTLLGYAKGEIGDDGESYKYLRDGEFSTHIALEIYDDEKMSSFVVGFVMDVSNNDKDTKKFYWASTSLSNIQFVKDDYAIDTKELEHQFKSIDCDSRIFPTQKEYRDALKVKLGNLNHKFFPLFRKATAFTPITDIRGFITDFICDTENVVEIDQMRENIRQYDRLRMGCEDVERMIGSLEDISKRFSDYEEIAKKLEIKDFLGFKSQCGLKEEEIEANIKGQADVSSDIKIAEERLMEAAAEEQYASQSLSVERDKLQAMKSFKREDEINKEVEQINNQNKERKDYFERKGRSLHNRIAPWKSAVEVYNQSHSNEHEKIDLNVAELITALRDQTFNVDIEEYLDEFSHIKMDATKRKRELDGEISKRDIELKDELELRASLNKGQRNYKKGLLETRSEIEKLLRLKHCKEIRVDIFCEMIDIKSDHWRNAIEGYLGHRRFNLIVDSEYYDDANRAYNEFAKSNNLHGFGLVDVAGIIDDNPTALSGSLFEEIESNDRRALIYAKSILGRVVKCEDIADQRKHRTSIMADCLLYKGRVSSRMNPKYYSKPFVGKASVHEQKKANLARISTLRDELSHLKKEIAPLMPFETLSTIEDEHIDDYTDARRRKSDYEVSLAKIKSLLEELESLDLEAVDRQRNKIKSMESVHSSKMAQRMSFENLIKRLGDTLGKLEDSKPVLEGELIDLENLLRAEYKDDIKRRKLTESYTEILEEKGSHEKMKNYGKYGITELRKETDRVFDVLVKVRHSFEMNERRSFDTTSRANDAYDKLLLTLKETELPSYKLKIEQARSRAQEEFKNDFVAKLKSNIESVERQIKDMNHALKSNVFGKDRYQFKVKPNREYRQFYDMITDPMLMEGHSLTHEVFQSKHQVALDELFKKITDTGEGNLSVDESSEIKKNVAKYTDYRTYLDFDLLVTNSEGGTQSLSKMISKKSGGETETPFYISILASFHRVYSMHSKRGNSTFRLVVLDEAFNKMDNQRVAECMSMLRDLGFQALVCAPPNKASHVLPHADMSLCCVRPSNIATFIPWKKAIESGAVNEFDE